jgi:Cobalamin-independent synthase, Catalytic domain
MVRDLCPHLPHLIELPKRGPGADMIGRTMSLLSSISSDLSVETTTTGWRLAQSRGRDMRRADAYLDEDLDVAEESFEGYVGDYKVQLVGPWTLAASVETSSGDKLLTDAGVCREVTEVLTHAVTQHIAEVSKRLPGANMVLQIDEPSLPFVLQGGIKTQSGWGKYSPIESQIVAASLQSVASATQGFSLLHCCARDVPFELIASAGFDAVSIDTSLFGDELFDVIGHAHDLKHRVFLGMNPVSLDAGLAYLSHLARRIGLSAQELANTIALSPPCGLVSATMSDARERIERLNAVSEAFQEVDL